MSTNRHDQSSGYPASRVFPSSHRPPPPLHSRFQNGASCLSVSSSAWPQHWAGWRRGGRKLARAQLLVAADGELLARLTGSPQASSRIGSLQGADQLLEIPAEPGALRAGTELGAQLLRFGVF